MPSCLIFPAATNDSSVLHASLFCYSRGANIRQGPNEEERWYLLQMSGGGCVTRVRPGSLLLAAASSSSQNSALVLRPTPWNHMEAALKYLGRRWGCISFESIVLIVALNALIRVQRWPCRLIPPFPVVQWMSWSPQSDLCWLTGNVSAGKPCQSL